MIRQRHWRARRSTLLWLLPWLVVVASACAQTSGGDTVFHLHGTVVNGITGKPLARALVTSADRQLATMSGSDGQFAIDISIPPSHEAARSSSGFTVEQGLFSGGIILMAQKPGYLASVRATIVKLDDKLASTNVEVKLMPAAQISGRISSAESDSVTGVRVTLLRRQVMAGDRMWSPIASETTNSRGEFRFLNLWPGEYTVITAEWRGDEPQPRTGVTQRYPPAFYGEAHDVNSATKLRLKYGDAAATEFHLHLTTYYPVTIPVAGNTPVNARIGEFGNFQLNYSSRDGAVEGSLPNGDYRLLLSSFGASPGFAILPLHVDGAPVKTARVALSPPGTIAVRVHTQFTRQGDTMEQVNMDGPVSRGGSYPRVPVLVEVVLRPAEISGGGVASQPRAGGELTLENVAPGQYLVQTMAFRGYVSSVSCGGVDLLQHPLVVGDGGVSEPIDVNLRDDTATLTGTVNFGNEPASASFIMILPADGGANYKQSYAGPDGKFTVPNLEPGSYRVLAYAGQPPQIAFRDPEVMHQYDGKGSTVIAAAGASLSVEVPLLNADDEEQ